MRMEERHGSLERKKGTVQPKQASGKVATGHMARAANEDSDSESSPDSGRRHPARSAAAAYLTRIVSNESSLEDDEEILELLNESDDEQEDIPLQEKKYNPNHNAEKIHLGGVKTLYYLDDVMYICDCGEKLSTSQIREELAQAQFEFQASGDGGASEDINFYDASQTWKDFRERIEVQGARALIIL